jgi:hypothetical protein
MERNLNVNAVATDDDAADFDNALADSDSASEFAPGRPPVVTNQGPCLYLGPSGQRCSRRAIDGSFCARHQPLGSRTRALTPGRVSRRAAAGVGVLAVLWPVLADLIRELLRLFR